MSRSKSALLELLEKGSPPNSNGETFLEESLFPCRVGSVPLLPDNLGAVGTVSSNSRSKDISPTETKAGLSVEVGVSAGMGIESDAFKESCSLWKIPERCAPEEASSSRFGVLCFFLV